MKKKFTYIIISILGAVILASCQAQTSEVPAPMENAAPASFSLVAEGKLIPAQSVDLSFYPSGGKIESVKATEGQLVKQEDVLAKLVITPQQLAAVAAAELELANADNARQNFLDQAAVAKSQAVKDVALAEERLKDARDKQRDKEATYRYSKTQESTIELAKAAADFDLATDELAYAVANAAKWDNGPDPDQLAVYDSRLNNAEEQLNAVKAAVSFQSQIIAPFDGQIISISINPGQVIQPNLPVITIADTSNWVVETIDVKEVNILSISLGSSAVVNIDAIPGEDFPAEVLLIQPLGVDQKGDITYKVTLSLQPDARFLWGLTTSVRFD